MHSGDDTSINIYDTPLLEYEKHQMWWLCHAEMQLAESMMICHVVTEVKRIYCQTSNISHTLVGTKIFDHSDVVGAAPIDAAPTTSSFST